VKRRTLEAFQELGPKNPLRRLDTRDQEFLWALLEVYFFAAAQPSDPKLEIELGSQAARTARDVMKLAQRLEDDIFRGPLSDELRPFLSQFENLPQVLRIFAGNVGAVLGWVGKPGRKSGLFQNQFLVTVSEFVRLKTGGFHDEHLAELIQGLGGRDQDSDFSGEIIRKKRGYLQKSYPLAYEEALKMAEQHTARPVVVRLANEE